MSLPTLRYWLRWWQDESKSAGRVEIFLRNDVCAAALGVSINGLPVRKRHDDEQTCDHERKDGATVHRHSWIPQQQPITGESLRQANMRDPAGDPHLMQGAIAVTYGRIDAYRQPC